MVVRRHRHRFVVAKTDNVMNSSADDFINGHLRAMTYYSLIYVHGNIEIADATGAKNFITDLRADDGIDCASKLRLMCDVSQRFAINAAVDFPMQAYED